MPGKDFSQSRARKIEGGSSDWLCQTSLTLLMIIHLGSFDYGQPERFGIPWRDLPTGSIIVNRPEPIFDKYGELVIGTLIVLTILVIMVIFLIGAIIQLRQAEKTLKESEEHLRVALEGTTDGIWDWDLRTGQVYFSPRYYTMLGYEPGEFPPTYESWPQLLHPDDAETAEMAVRRALEEHTPFAIESRLKAKSGEWRWILVRGKVVELDMAGGAVRMAGSHADITERKQAEEQLRLIADNMVDTITQTDATRSVVYVSSSVKRVFGYEPDDIMGQSILDLVHPDDVDRLLVTVREAIAAHTPSVLLEYRYRHANGEYLWVESTTRLLFDENDQFTGAIFGSRDITGRKQTEEALRENEFFLRKSQSVAQLGSYYFDARTGKWISSPALDEIFGITNSFPKDVEGWIALVHPEQREEMLLYLSQYVLAQHNRFDKEYQITRPDNQQERWVHGLGELEFDASGNSIKMIGTIQDITERKQAEEALRLTQQAVDRARDAIHWVGADGKLLYVNETTCQSLGYTREELLSMTVFDIDPLFSKETWPDHWQRETGHYMLETIHKAKDGRLFPVEILVDRVNYAGKEFNCSYARDITERKQTETALRESEERFRLFMHHFPGLAYIKDSATRVLFANQGFMTYLNIAPAELPGKTNQDIFPTEFAERITADDLRLFESGQSQEIEEHYGGRIWSTYKFILPQPDHPPLLGGFTLDITERKRTEAQLERNLRETRVRFEISQALAGTETEDEVLDVLIQHAGLYPQAFVAIFTFDRTGGELVAIVRRQDTFESGLTVAMSIGEGLPASRYTLFGHFFADQSFVSEDVRADERFEPAGREILEQTGVASFAAIPLTVGNEWMGYIGAMAKSTGYFDEEKQHLYQTLAEQGAVALRAARLRETIRASQQRLSLLVQQSPLTVIEWDVDFRVVSWNPAAEQIFGYTAEEALGCHMADLIVPAAARPLVDQVQRDLLAQKGGTHSINDNLTKDGRIITCEWFNASLVGADGRVIGIASLARNITEHKRVEAELRTSEARYRALVQSQIDLISRYLPDTTLTFVNDAYCQFYGKTREELIGQSFLTMVGPEFHEQGLKETENFVKDPRLISGEYLNYRWDGKECWIHWILQGIVDDNGQVVEIQASGRDITPLKQAEEEIRRLNEELEQRVIERTGQLEAANKELEAFSYSVSHDLRAPLRAIDGYTRILVEDYEAALDAEGKRICAVIRDRTQRMDQLINDLLAFSRLSRTQMRLSPIDMVALANAVFDELTTPEERARIDLRLALLPPVVGDSTMIRQVWINLLSNAIKFSAKRERAVIEVSSQQSEGEIIYSVQDNGAGFDMRYVDKLFGVFQRLHSEREFEGTGVGLAIVQRIIHRHGGRVWAEGAVDQGATFYFTLPRKGD